MRKRYHRLTEEERTTILQLRASGLHRNEIAKETGIPEATVRHHIYPKDRIKRPHEDVKPSELEQRGYFDVDNFFKSDFIYQSDVR